MVSSLLTAEELTVPAAPGEPKPWFTGPLIAPPAVIVHAGHIDVEPYAFSTAVQGFYGTDWHAQKNPTFWNNSLQILIETGLTNWMDIQIYPSLYYNVCQGQSDWVFGDLSMGFNFALLEDPIDKGWYPGMKLSLQMLFPTGRYQRLNPAKQKTDVGGGGSYVPVLGLVVSKTIHFTGDYYLNSYLSLEYSVPLSNPLKSFNCYGGGFGTRGTYYPGQLLFADLAFECNLSRNWVYAMDIVYTYRGNSTFKGYAGVDAQGNPAQILQGTSVQFSLAPAIEYNWSQSFGIIAGCWFSVAGRLTPSFVSGVIAFNYYK